MRKYILLVALVCSCRREAPPPPPAPTVQPETSRLPLGERLHREAQARPSGTPRSEEVLAALARGGLKVARQRQVLASTLGAAYCASAITEGGVALAVCEYPAEEAARKGMAYSHEAFDHLIPGRRLAVNRKTLLTVTGASEADARTATTIFAGL